MNEFIEMWAESHGWDAMWHSDGRVIFWLKEGVGIKLPSEMYDDMTTEILRW